MSWACSHWSIDSFVVFFCKLRPARFPFSSQLITVWKLYHECKRERWTPVDTFDSLFIQRIHVCHCSVVVGQVQTSGPPLNTPFYSTQTSAIENLLNVNAGKHKSRIHYSAVLSIYRVTIKKKKKILWKCSQVVFIRALLLQLNKLNPSKKKRHHLEKVKTH